MSIETNRPKGLASRRDFLRWGATSSALSFAAPGSKIDAPGQVQRYNVLGRTGEAILRHFVRRGYAQAGW